MQSGLPVFFVSEFGTFEIFMQNDGLEKPEFSYFPTANIKIDHIWTEYDHILPFTIHKSSLLRFWSIYKASKVGMVEKRNSLITPKFLIFPKIK